MTDEPAIDRAEATDTPDLHRSRLSRLFVDGQQRVMGAHIVTIGGQHAIAIDVRAIMRAAFAADEGSGRLPARRVTGQRTCGSLV